MKILISGASGLVGKRLSERLKKRGDEVVKLVRKPNEDGVYWNIPEQRIDESQLEGFDCVVHLAGESIAEGRWSEEKKNRIYNSRIDSTRLLVNSFKHLKSKPKRFLSASAIGYYQHTGHQKLTEDSAAGDNFLARVCIDWEGEARKAESLGISCSQMRIGIVLSAQGGALAKMALPFRLGLGGKVGSGEQYMPWIDLDDLVQAIAFLMDHPEIQGPVNLVSPEPIKQVDFAKELASYFHKPAFFNAPETMLKLIIGEMAEELLLSSYRVIPKVLQEHGFQFEYTDLSKSFKNQLS